MSLEQLLESVNVISVVGMDVEVEGVEGTREDEQTLWQLDTDFLEPNRGDLANRVNTSQWEGDRQGVACCVCVCVGDGKRGLSFNGIPRGKIIPWLLTETPRTH